MYNDKLYWYPLTMFSRKSCAHDRRLAAQWKYYTSDEAFYYHQWNFVKIFLYTLFSANASIVKPWLRGPKRIRYKRRSPVRIYLHNWEDEFKQGREKAFILLLFKRRENRLIFECRKITVRPDIDYYISRIATEKYLFLSIFAIPIVL